MTTNQKIAKKFRELADLFESLDDNSSGSPAKVTYEPPWAIDEWRYNNPIHCHTPLHGMDASAST